MDLVCTNRRLWMGWPRVDLITDYQRRMIAAYNCSVRACVRADMEVVFVSPVLYHIGQPSGVLNPSKATQPARKYVGRIEVFYVYFVIILLVL